jgi:tetratricopeptide (TPR) repeat protein
MARAWLHLMVLLVAVAPAWAAPSGTIDERAAEHVAAANRAFRAGDYDRALGELEVGYAIDPRREFLITFAQVYAAMGRLDQAIDRCERYLALAPTSPVAASVRQLARTWRRQRDDEAAGVVEPPATGTVARVHPPPLTGVVSAATAATPVERAAEKAAQPPPARQRRVILALLGGAVVGLVGVIIGVGLSFGLRDNAPGSTLGAVPFQ